MGMTGHNRPRQARGLVIEGCLLGRREVTAGSVVVAGRVGSFQHNVSSPTGLSSTSSLFVFGE